MFTFNTDDRFGLAAVGLKAIRPARLLRDLTDLQSVETSVFRDG